MANLSFICDFVKVLSKCVNCASEGWKLVGQEQDGTILVTWETLKENRDTNYFTSIGIYNNGTKNLQVIHNFESKTNVIQASINASKSLLLYVTKYAHNKAEETNEPSNIYELHGLSLSETQSIASEMKIQGHHQVMAQFLYRKKGGLDRFLTFVHQEGINLYQINCDPPESEFLKVYFVHLDIVVKVFSWAQWDVQHQCLYYIYYRKTLKANEIGEVKEEDMSPTFSSLQFNDDFPHETVLNIPLNLPSKLDSPFNTYEDEPIPLRVTDSSLDVIVLSDTRGVVCICHRYLYQPVKMPVAQDDPEDQITVHFAYTVTILHHGLLVHCKIPGIPWQEANNLRPTFAIHEDDYLVVYLPGLLTHLLDLGLGHQPYCHIILPHEAEKTEHWTTIKMSHSRPSLLNTKTLKMYDLEISTNELMKVFYDANIGLYNKLSIIHYFLVHKQDFDTICNLLIDIVEYSLNPSLQQIFHEILVSGTYASVMRSLPQEATKLLQYLPLTTMNHVNTIEIKGVLQTMTLTQEALWNPSVRLLTPQQRLCQFRVDLWTQLWNLITQSSGISRFKSSTVAEKLMVSLVCYQPEALSRCSTPLSPGSGFSVNASLLESANIGNYKAKHLLPFFEIEKCTASKQEHVISVNLRELSIHLVKHGLENPLQVHVVATRYAAAQLEMTRFLCSIITKSCAIPVHQSKGFQLIDELPLVKRKVYFAILERYASSIDVLAYPTPQGFASFFTYLAYKTLPFNKFVQYVQAKALSLQIDVMKVILPGLNILAQFILSGPGVVALMFLFFDIHFYHRKYNTLEVKKYVGDDYTGLKNKLRLLQLLPRSRAKRLLNQWSHPMSLILRAREHSLSILSGIESRSFPPTRSYISKGIESFQNRYPPLDSFLDLLTAKASLAELDFNLLVEATMTSLEKLYEGHI